jgi:hypothetical protein
MVTKGKRISARNCLSSNVYAGFLSIQKVFIVLKDIYNSELIERFSKHNRRLKNYTIIIECLLNQSHNKYSQDIMYMKNC